MKKSVIITCTIVFILWTFVLCFAVGKTVSTDVIGGADLSTLQCRLTECLRSPFGLTVQLITIAAAVFLVVLVIKSFFMTRNGN